MQTALVAMRIRWGQVRRDRAGRAGAEEGEAATTARYQRRPLPNQSIGRPSWRLITSRCTSLVPSPISRILESR